MGSHTIFTLTKQHQKRPRGTGEVARLAGRPTTCRLTAKTPRWSSADAWIPAVSLEEDRIFAFCDGSTAGKNRVNCAGGSGVVLFWKHHVKLFNEWIERGTNNVAELHAIEMGFDEIHEPKPLIVFTDSEYAIGSLTRHWKIKKNVDLITRIRGKSEAYQARAPVELRHVRGHSGVPGNELADYLAKLAARKETMRKSYSHGVSGWEQFKELWSIWENGPVALAFDSMPKSYP